MQQNYISTQYIKTKDCSLIVNYCTSRIEGKFTRMSLNWSLYINSWKFTATWTRIAHSV